MLTWQHNKGDLGYQPPRHEYQEVGTSTAEYGTLSHATMPRADTQSSSMLALPNAMITVRRQ
jgi:hypothetical protein